MATQTPLDLPAMLVLSVVAAACAKKVVVEVKPGYARNYLLPYGHAVVPTEENLRTLEQYKIKVQKAREAKIADLKVLAEQIQRISVTVEANATDEGHLYGSVGQQEISKALRGRKAH